MMKKVMVAMTNHFADFIAQHGCGRGIDKNIPALQIQANDAFGGGVENRHVLLTQQAIPFLPLSQQLPLPIFFGHIAEHQHGPDGLAVRAQDRSVTVGDLVFLAVRVNQDAMVGQFHTHPLAQHLLHGIDRRSPSLGVDDVENLPQRFAQGRRLGPTGEAVGHGVEDDDVPGGIAGAHAIADGAQSDAQALLFVGQFRGALCDLQFQGAVRLLQFPDHRVKGTRQRAPFVRPVEVDALLPLTLGVDLGDLGHCNHGPGYFACHPPDRQAQNRTGDHHGKRGLTRTGARFFQHFGFLLQADSRPAIGHGFRVGQPPDPVLVTETIISFRLVADDARHGIQIRQIG